MFSLGLYANGGVTIHSSVTATGSPVFVDMPDVSIVSEKLYFVLDCGYSHIKVNYTFCNNSDTDYNDLDYGFPIDYMAGPRYEDLVQWENDYLTSIHFIINGQQLPHTISPETLHKEEYGVYRKWCFTKLYIPKNSMLSLEVNYTIKNGYISDGHSPLNLDFSGTGSYLCYDFSPAKHFGDGIVKDFYIEIDATVPHRFGSSDYYYPYFFPTIEGFNEEFETQINERGFYAPGFDFKKKEEVYTYSTHNFDLKEAEPLHLSYWCEPDKDVSSIMLDKNKYSISASTEIAKYPVSNLNDMDFETAWVASNGGVGEWIEITMKKRYHMISGLTIVNGYMKSEKTFTENNRIKKIQLGFKGSNNKEYNNFIVDLGDWELKRPYQPVIFKNLIDNFGWIDFFDYGYDSENGEDYLDKIRITILEVQPGTKYNDTCVSEIILY